MTVGELITILSVYPHDKPVVATWEGIFRNIDTYISPDGYVIIDADRNNYKERILSGKNKVWIPDIYKNDEEDE